MHNEKQPWKILREKTHPDSEKSVIVVEVEVVIHRIAREGRSALVGPAANVQPGIDPCTPMFAGFHRCTHSEKVI